MNQKTKVCFVSLYAYSLFNTNTSYKFGGAEFRAWNFARQLAKYPGYEVTVVVFNYGQPPERYYDNITVYGHSYYKSKTSFMASLHDEFWNRVEKTSSIPFFRFKELDSQTLFIITIYPFLVLCNRVHIAITDFLAPYQIEDYKIPHKKVETYREIDADVYIMFGASNLAAEVTEFCRNTGKKHIFFAASDSDLSESYKRDSHELNTYLSFNFLCHYAITQASLILTQTAYQKKILKERFNRNSIIIQNPIDLSCHVENVPPYNERRVALWVGKSDTVKRPEILIELANTSPETQFVMVMNLSNQAIFDQITQQKPSNVIIHETIPVDEIENFFAQSFVLINTSIFEGFPNTFLQAGKYGVPVLSLTVDPDSFLTTYNCGIVADGDFDDLVNGLDAIKNNHDKARELSTNIQRYVIDYHDLENKVAQLDASIRQLLDGKGA